MQLKSEDKIKIQQTTGIRFCNWGGCNEKLEERHDLYCTPHGEGNTDSDPNQYKLIIINLEYNSKYSNSTFESKVHLVPVLSLIHI